VDEDAIEPLWKGRRFPLSACISGWSMVNRRSVVIQDIYQDPRIPLDAYRPTFVKSLAMVPIGKEDPVGAIGNYWARNHTPDSQELRLLETLAEAAYVTIQGVRAFEDLERRVEERTALLQAANQELEAFSYSVSHDLRAPLRGLDGFSLALAEDFRGKLGPEGEDYIRRIRAAASRMAQLIEDILTLSRVTRAEMRREEVDLSALAETVLQDLRRHGGERAVKVEIEPGLRAAGDSRLLVLVLQNLLGNAWKFTAKRERASIRFRREGAGFVVEDDGAGFDPRYTDKLFAPFQRLHTASEFPGTGVGLAIVQRIVRRHGGRVWAEGEVDKGARFGFTLSPGLPK
jgi:signal transduction histidine kinase